MFRLLLLVCCLVPALTPTLVAYEQPRPNYIEADVTFRDGSDGAERTERGQLWFVDLPRLDERGRVRGFGTRGYMEGIKWFVPVEPGDIWLAAVPEADDPRVFLLHDYLEERRITLAFDRIDVGRTDRKKRLEYLEKQVDRLGRQQDTGEKDLDAEIADLMGEKREDELDPNRAEGEALAWKRPEKQEDEGDAEKPSPLFFATDEPIGRERIPLADVVRIEFRSASGGLAREEYTGRYVQYSKQAKGDEGRVRVRAATYFGGELDERFKHGDFASDGSVLLGGDFRDLSFVDPGLMRVLGPDPAADAYPPETITYGRKKNKTRTIYPRTTVALVHYSEDLQRLLEVVRLPWGSGRMHKCFVGPDDAVYIGCWAGPQLDALVEEVGDVPVVPNPEAVRRSQEPDKKGRTRPLGDDGFVVKLAPGLERIEWLVRFKYGLPDIFLRPDGTVLARRSDELFYIDTGGRVSDGPQLDITGSHMTVDPATGDMYFGGSYRWATGLEPWVCPYLYKVGADGKIRWSAYDWTGPIVGVQRFRLVSDSSVSKVAIGENGRLSFIGWSDGGNTVFTRQPYDLRESVPSAGFCSSTWGATGGLTVRIANIVQLDGNELEALSRTQYVSYLPTSDVPALLNLYDVETMPNGDVAVTGACRIGFVETWDAWEEPWYLQYRTDRFAQAKSGTFFTLFRPGFGPPRMATRTCGVSGGQLARKGGRLMLYSACGGPYHKEARTRGTSQVVPIVERAVQAQNGGGMDAYVMLIDTQGEPDPPEIPDWTWESRDYLRAEKQREREEKKRKRREIR